MDCVVASMGTTGTLMGLSRRMKEYSKEIRIVGVESYLGHGIQGLKNMKEAHEPGPMLYNTRTGRREMFAPKESGVVTLYSCGPTVHQRMDLSLLCRFLFSDLLSRYLTFRGFSVRHIINITDLDDKTIAGAVDKRVLWPVSGSTVTGSSPRDGKWMEMDGGLPSKRSKPWALADGCSGIGFSPVTMEKVSTSPAPLL